jgi:hypothetical protein
MSIAEIEAAISQLPRREFAELMSWLQQYEAEAWNRQIEEDLAAGRLDRLISEAESENEARLARSI